ncbi:MAG TPA: 4Fe-4S binding protein, partial [Tepidisphaeraceae bacterium]
SPLLSQLPNRVFGSAKAGLKDVWKSEASTPTCGTQTDPLTVFPSALPGRGGGVQSFAMAKKKLPKVLALLDEDMCTGCEACMHVCPVDCIEIVPGPRHESVFQVCSIDLPRCIGCTLCAQMCPWDCITMLPTDQFLQNENTVKQLE